MALLIAATVVMAGATGQAAANPRYAAYVMDANTGQVLFSRNGDAKRYPASLTKMMTTYMLFEAMESGRISASTQIPISAKAAAEPPTKIGLKAGSSISVDNAIKALVTRSANDIATAVGEMLGGSEQAFARMMTAKARQLGMNSTQFRNAHGLPNADQYTTARDMAILGIALREHFPKQYSYFSTRSFKFGKNTITTHNRMLSRVKGVDGIKTGYIRASGFNVVTSIQDNGRSVVAVVMGGQSGRSRDDHMTALLQEYLPKASRGGGANLVASRRLTPGTPAAVAGAFSLPNTNIPTPDFRPGADIDVQVAAYANEQAGLRVTPQMPVPSAPVPTAQSETIAAVQQQAASIDPVQTSSTRPTGWAVQIASSPSENEALAALERIGARAPNAVGSATAFTETYNNKGTTYYRARFGGYASKDQAWNACNALKRSKIDCYAVQL
ncbi:D-alanyl-D-alanine carboxypeptidase [Mesorhizobium sp. CAU 1732]|uniref:D-alanyl-D-alanine carboxypeptidase n=1 Tax=Mesorhizobium sp. CAU 1732 TaxID=3140358 RepID=UPI0032607A46